MADIGPYEPRPGDVTYRFRADTSLAYSGALRFLLEYARGHDDDFAMGPVNVRAMRQHGLAVSGPEYVVGPLTDLLVREVPGLYRDEE